LIVGKVFQPAGAFIIVCIVFHVEVDVLVAASAQQIDATASIRIALQIDGPLAQAVSPQVGIKFSVAEMVRVIDERALPLEAADQFPQHVVQGGIVQLIWRR
jgi:hypothetical protein